jgi:amino acid adenylation domain-containing protein/non-ribosomal peptide synthase protein (TIGR01720 family)
LHKAELVKLLQKKSNAGDTDLPQIPVSLRKNLPLSFAQEGLWFLSQLEPTNPFYNEPLALRLQGTLNVVALEKSLNKIIQRHEALRTNFKTLEGQPVQVIAQRLTLSVQVIDLSELPEREREIAWELKARTQVQQPFDLSSSGLIQASVLQLTETEHVLLLTIHHMVWDSPSEGLFVKELAAFYTAYCNDLQRELPPLPIQYPDFAVWQRQRLQGDLLESQLAYWKQKLEGAPALLELPTDRVRRVTQTFRGACYRQALSKELTEALMILSQRQGVTLFMTLLAALFTLLYRYTGQSDICVGTPYAGRDRAEIEGLIGLFVNTLVLRTDISGNPSFEELLSRVRDVALGAYAHADLPFEKLVEQLQPERSLSYTPYFQVMFVLYSPMPQIDMEGLTVSRVAVETGTAKFDLSLSFENTASGLIGKWEYNTDLFDASTITRLAGHFQTLLEGIVANSQQQVSSLPLLTQRERHQLLWEWNNTTKEYPQDKCIHELFEAQVERSPDTIAVVFEDKQLTYRELNQRANCLAHHLKTLGVEPEVLVGICVERSLEMVVGLLGILKAGGAYVPLDPSYPQDRLRYMLEDAGVQVLLTQGRLVSSLPKHNARVVCLDTLERAIALLSESNPISGVVSGNLAYVIYTSGSTGLPKGVLVNHSNIVRLFEATNDWFHFDERDVWTLFHSYAFDFSVWELWGALIYGGRLVVVPYLVSRDSQAFLELLCQEKVTILNQTPSAFRQLMKAEESKAIAPDLKLRLVIFGGEALEPKSLKPWFERHGDGTPQLVNMYGITETTVHVTYRPLTIADINNSASVIGPTIPDLQVYLLDQHQQLVPIGVPGEMYIGGAGVARGYLNRPELTAQRFISNPFSDNPEALLYKSGDKARYLPNGELEYLGRIDQQVKIRGFRIELGEIEALLAQHPAVWESVVLVREDEPGDKRLVAYVVPNAEQSLKAGELRSFLKEKLPEYMVPAAFVQMSALPLTANGKVDRSSLPKPDTARPELEQAYQAPSTPNQKLLADIWTQVLGLEQIGIHDNFFALGGDSIRSIQVQSLAQKHGLSFSVQQLFQHQTIHELVQELKTEDEFTTKIELSQPFSLISEVDKQQLPDGVEDAYPLTMLQKGMIFHSEYSQESAIYHDIFSYHLKAPLNVQTLQTAVQHLVNHHAVLRTSFQLSGFSIPLQLVHQKVEVPLQVEDWCHFENSEQEDALATWFEAEKKRYFDWTHPPLLRFFIQRRTQDTFNLTVSFHHAILDGWSVASMVTELLKRYLSLLGEQVDSVSPPLSIAFRDFVALEQQAIASEECQRYWMEKLNDSTFTKLPRWPSIPRETNVQQVGVQDVPLSPEICEGLKQLALSAQVPLKSVLLAAHLRVLSLLGGQSDVLTGLVANGRPEQTDGERVLGLFLNTLPFRLRLSGGTWIDLVRSVFEAERELLPHRRYPMVEIQRRKGGQPLFETSFNFVHFHVYQRVLGLKNLQLLGGKFFEQTNFTFVADFSLEPNSSQIELSFAYDTSKLCSQQINRISGYYVRALAAMASEPLKRYELHSLLSFEEEHQLLVEWNSTQADYPKDLCIHELFEAQVEQTPDAIAVVFEDKQLTYLQLNQRANCLAHHLRTRGVGPEVLVGICVERSLEMMVGLLGILKAGGAYVPLDPQLPQERLSFMLSDSSVPVLLTKSKLMVRLPENKARVVCLDTDWGIISHESEENPVSSVEPQNLAYVIYTSGSTGQPKGTLIIHQGLVNYLGWCSSAYAVADGSGAPVHSSIGFDATITSLFSPLLVGKKVVLLPEKQEIEALGAILCSQSQFSLVKITPAHLDLLSFLIPNWSANNQTRAFIIGGEALSGKNVSFWRDKAPSTKLINEYGPTEAVVGCCVYEVDAQTNLSGGIPIGRPIANTQLYILDPFLQPVPIGVLGELYIGGAGVARGYLNRPDLTREKFIPNPFSNQPGSRLYKTGDKARYLNDGNIEFLGRIDNQVKIRGFRIELGEIEAAIAQYPGVRETAVIAREDVPSHKYLVAYIVPNHNDAISSSDLRVFLKEKLPDYMIPGAFVHLDALPLTSNGKVDRKALLIPDTARQELQAKRVAPRTRAEEILAQIWCEVLHREFLSIHDNFFELGGDSILSIQIISKANSAGFHLTPKQIFQYQTIADLAAVATTTETLKAFQGLVTGSLPLTPIQHWFFEQNLPSPHHWNQAFLLEVQQKLDPTKLQQAVQQLLVHHDALRLRFTQSDSGWQQVNALTDEIVPFSLIDLSTLPPNQLSPAIEAKATELQASLNLESGPLLQVALFHLGESIPDRLLLVIHHLAVDGVSWRILLEDLQTTYKQLHSGQPIQLQSKTTSFKHWAEKLTEYAQTDAAKEELTYWQNISSTSITHLPIDCSGGANTEASARTVSVSLNTEETRALLTEVPKAYRTRINDVLLTALVQVLANWSQSTSILIDLEGHGREEILPDVDLSRTVGWFTTIFPVLLKLVATENLGETLKSIKEQLRAIPNRGIGYGLLRYLSGDAEITSQLSSIPQAEVSFNYLGQFDWGRQENSLFKLATESIGPEHNKEGHRRHLLDINGIVVEGQLQLDWTYSDSFHQRATIEGLAHNYIQALRTIITHCLSPEVFGYTPSDFPLAKLEPKELDNLLTQLSEISSRSLKEKIEDIYPLSPVQQGILFHSLYAPDDGVYFVQSIWRMQGNLNVEAFAQAWQQVVKRHPILRTAFVWSSSDKPLQVVYREGKIPLEIHDWRGLSTEEREQQLETFLVSDRQKGFQLSLAPLMRLFLMQIEEDTYQFVWSSHHLLLDGWSVPPVIKEVFTFYEAFCRGTDVKLEPVRHYRDYIAWLLKQDLALAEVFWRQTLKGFIAPTPLTVDSASTTRLNQHQRYSEQSIQLTVQLTEELKSFARQHQLTLSTLVQGAWAILLSRYSGEADVVFGVTVSGRSAAIKGVESIVGLLINTLPMRVRGSADDSLIPWLYEVQNQLQQVSQYEYSPLVQIQQWSEVPRGVPLFESIVVFENYPEAAEFGEQNLNLQISDVRSLERTNYPLTVVAEPGTHLSLHLKYDCQRFDDATIARMASHFQTLLEGIVTNPTQLVSQLPLLTLRERHQLLVEWNNTAKEYPQDKCIHHLFEQQVERTPNTAAVVFEGEQLTYQQLNARANKIAHYLQSLGVGSEVLVGICVERSLEMIVGLLGILKAGGAYVPLDPTYPSERLRYMLEDSGVQVLLTQEKLVSSLGKHNAHVVCLDTLERTIAIQSKSNPISGVTPDNLAYVIYTSGSTGKPKGAMNTHQGICNRLQWMQETYQLTPADCVLQKTPFSFDVSVWEFFWPLLTGARLVVAKPDGHKDSAYLVNLILEQQITTLHFVPSMLQVFLEEQGLERCSCLKRTFCSGEALPKKLQERFFATLSCELHNLYGPTEAAIDVTFWQCKPESNLSTVPIGHPIANTQIYILNGYLQPVPVGVAGELYIGGHGLARGYLNRPDLTDEKFISNPFSNQPGSRLYKTGDKARYLSDGNIEFLGRLDNQVKIRGFRIELGEIEAALAQYLGVRETVVIAREDVPGHKYLVAYIVPNHESALAFSDLRSFLSEKLPNYMIPGAFVILDALPLTSNGKVDRRALPAPEFQSELQRSLVATRTPIEEMLASIWADVLLIELVGVHHNLFELGGHSLLAIQVISRVRDTFAVELPLRSLFEAPTIAEFASLVEHSLSNGQSQQAEPLLPIPRSESIPLSFAQARLWFLDQLQPNSSLYNIPLALRLFGQLNIAALQSSINEIIRRHEALRTNFTTQEGQPVAVIASTLNLELLVVDLLHLGESSREIEAQRLAKVEANRPFNLEQEPLLRGTVLHLGETEYVLLLTMHHIISDGWSLGVFIRELTELYKAFCTGITPVLPSLPVQYADFALWQRQWLQGEILAAQLDYWKQQLKNAPALLELPTSRPRRASQTFRGGYYYAALSSQLSAELTALSKRTGVTRFMTLLAAFVTLLYRYSGSDDIVVGTPVAGRHRREIEGLIGFFVNTIVLRTYLGGDPSFEDVLSRVRVVALGAYTHQDLPFEQLVEALQPERSLSYAPLFQVMFALDEESVPSFELPELTVSEYAVEISTAKFDLTLSMENTADGLVGVWGYNADLFDETTIARLASHFQTLLEGIVANPTQQISQLPLLTDSERYQLLVEWNNTTQEYPQDKCIHQLFEEQVERNPDAIAVVFEGFELTYQKLNQRANCLAHYLKTLGVGPEVLVGICVERSLEMVVGLLGILKAGGAYLPLDPALPKESLAFRLIDAQVPILLTQKGLFKRENAQVQTTLYLDADGELVAQQSSANPNSEATPENLAYVLYTSGSTGQPKGVAIEHRQILNYLHAILDKLQLPNAASFATVSTFAADLGNTVIFPALCTGGCLHIVSQERATDPKALAEYFLLHPIDCLKITPTHLASLLTSKVFDSILPRQCLVLGGEAASWDLIEKIQQEAPNCRILNHYGPTETTVGVLTYPVSSKPASYHSKTVPIGRPIANTQVYILDRYQQPVPIGVPGGLYIGGDGLARGYLNRPDLTDEKFVPNPFNHQLGSRLYKTGDRARYLSDGNIEFLGRLDNQVKIRGFRIELGEIETAIAAYPSVRETVVVAREDVPGDKRLVAYIVPIQVPPTYRELRDFLLQKLPGYMVPNAIVVLSTMPLTSNGKVDRRALPEPDSSPSDSKGFVPPRDTIEQQLQRIWSEVLQLSTIGVHDNFFELGGHSLLAVRLMARLEQHFGLNLPLATLLATPTIEQLASCLRASPDSCSWSPLVAIQSSGDKKPFFCVPGVGGNVIYLYELARHLGLDQPFYGFSAKGLDGESKPFTRVEDIATYYIEAMQTLQPNGPYLLGGHSFGGVVAFEMAIQLRKMGHEVALVAIIDALAPISGSKPNCSNEEEAANLFDFACYIESMFSLNLEISKATLADLTTSEQLHYLKERLIRVNLLPPDAGIKLVRGLVQVYMASLKAHRSYLPKQVLPTRIALLSAQDIDERKGDTEEHLQMRKEPTLGWKEMSGTVDVHMVPGNHMTMMQKPQVQALAEQLQVALEQAQTYLAEL